MNSDHRLPALSLQVLGTVLMLAQRGEPVTLRAILRAMGRRPNTNLLWHSLNRLRRAELVTWDKGRRATLRPLCRMVLFG